MWWDGGGRAWHHSVDVPGDIPIAEAVMVARNVVGLDRAVREVMDSGISDFTKDVVRRLVEANMRKWLEGVDLGLLNV